MSLKSWYKARQVKSEAKKAAHVEAERVLAEQASARVDKWMAEYRQERDREVRMRAEDPAYDALCTSIENRRASTYTTVKNTDGDTLLLLGVGVLTGGLLF
jgi:hypothetical protein